MESDILKIRYDVNNEIQVDIFSNSLIGFSNLYKEQMERLEENKSTAQLYINRV